MITNKYYLDLNKYGRISDLKFLITFGIYWCKEQIEKKNEVLCYNIKMIDIIDICNVKKIIEILFLG